MRTKGMLVLLLFAVLISTAFVSGKDQTSSKAIGKPQKASHHESSGKSAASPQQAPDFTLKTLSGKTLSLKDFRGRYVLVNLWASWCGPCQKEAPQLNKIDKAFSDKRLMILGVNMTSQEGSIKNVKHFVKKEGISFPILLDRSGEVMNRYHVIGIPTSYLIDPKGKVLQRFRGAVTLAEIKKIMK